MAGRTAGINPSKKMSLKFYSFILQQPIKPMGKKAVALVLADYVSDHGKSYPRIETFKKMTGLTEEQIEFALQGLIDDKIIRDTGIRVGDQKEIRVFEFHG